MRKTCDLRRLKMATKKKPTKKNTKKPKKQSGIIRGKAALKGDKTIYND